MDKILKIGNFILDGCEPTPIEQSLIDGTFEELLASSNDIDEEDIPEDFLEVQDFDVAMEEIKQEIDCLPEEI